MCQEHAAGGEGRQRGDPTAIRLGGAWGGAPERAPSTGGVSAPATLRAAGGAPQHSRARRET
eukprot:2984370-Pyramimonas_sp.AAC.1